MCYLLNGWRPLIRLKAIQTLSAQQTEKEEKIYFLRHLFFVCEEEEEEEVEEKVVPSWLATA